MLADGGKELDGRKGAVGDQYDISIGQPAMDLPSSLAGPIEQRLGRARFAIIEAFGGGEQGEEGERHDAIGPRRAKLVAKAQATRDAAERKHQEKSQSLDAERSAIEKRIEAEDTRWAGE